MDEWKQIRKRKLEQNSEKFATCSKFSKLDPDITELPDVEKCKKNQQSDLEIIELSDEEASNKQYTCQYGINCYRKNPIHFKKFDHPDISESSFDQKSRSLFKFTTIDRLKNQTNSISIQEILSMNKEKFLESAQFNYCFDLEWLIDQYPNEHRDKPLLIVHGPSNETQLKEMLQYDIKENIKLCKAKLEIPYGTHHTKMMLLWYTNGIQVVIHTANLIKEDWGQKTQGVWMSGLLPRVPKDLQKSTSTDSKTYFKMYLKTYLEHYDNPLLTKWIQLVDEHDMSSVNVHLVGSIPGRHPVNKKLFGHLRLRKLLGEHLKTEENATEIVCQFSSIGSLGPTENSWLCKEFIDSLSSQNNSKTDQNLKPICIFPCISDVRNSFEGYIAGTSIPYSIKTALKQIYLNKFLYKWNANSNLRTRASPHIKSYARYSNDYKKLFWFLLTSSNLSKAAWGSYEKNNSQLFIRSYELGVLFLPKFFVGAFWLFERYFYFYYKDFICFKKEITNDYFDLENMKTVLYDLPPVKYGENDKPWVYDVRYMQPDSNGHTWNTS